MTKAGSVLLLGMAPDAATRHELEARLLHGQQLQSAGFLAGGLAHDLNNLLAAILGYTALGQRSPDIPAPAADCLQRIAALSDRAHHLTHQLLAFVRKPTSRPQPTSLDDFLRATAELAQRTLKSTVELHIETPGETVNPFGVCAEGNRLQQAILNLAANARDALPAPAPVRFRLRHAVLAAEQPAFPAAIPPGDYAVIEVEDDGCGMTPEVLGQALDPFFTTKQPGHGTGLGLPLVLDTVRAHGGHLRIDTAPGRGTCVGLYLPRCASGVAPERSADHATPTEPASVWGRQVRVVDRPEEVLDVVRRYLEEAGDRMTYFVCGGEPPGGLARLRQDGPAASAGAHRAESDGHTSASGPGTCGACANGGPAGDDGRRVGVRATEALEE